MKTLDFATFRDLIVQNAISTKIYPRNSDAIEAVDLLVTIEQFGDRVLKLTRDGKLSAERAAVLIHKLTTCYTDPLEDTKHIIEIGDELRGHGR